MDALALDVAVNKRDTSCFLKTAKPSALVNQQLTSEGLSEAVSTGGVGGNPPVVCFLLQLLKQTIISHSVMAKKLRSGDFML